MICQLVWTTKDEVALEQAVPLQWHGEFMAQQGWSNNLTIGFMAGIEKVSKSYLADLERLGYQVLDCAPLASKCLKQHPALCKHDITSRFWFLRWNVMEILARDLPATETVVHLDGDVVLLADAKEIYNDVAGKTFMLQGCPVLTAISNKEWFSVWQRELATYLAAPEQYCAQALRTKEHPARLPRESCNILAYAPGRFEDQDMLEYLIAAAKLPQASTPEVYDSVFYWVQNPLYPGEWHAEQNSDAQRRVKNQNGGFFVGEKQVPFLHFQSDFARFCDDWLFLERLGLSGLSTTAHLRPETLSMSPSQCMMRTLRFLKRKKPVRRRQIQEALFRKNPRTGNLYITDLINCCWD